MSRGYSSKAGIEYEFCYRPQLPALIPTDHFAETAESLAEKRGHGLKVQDP